MIAKTIPDPATKHAIDLFLKRIAGLYAIAEVWLYGSRARGDAKPGSDADVALVLEGPMRRTMDVGLEMSSEEFGVMLETGVLVSALPVYREAWDDPAKHSNPYLIANIKREGIAVGG